MAANKGRRLPQLPTERPLPELPTDEVPYSSRFPTKTPPPTRRYFTDSTNTTNSVPHPPPLSTLPKSSSAYFNHDRISLPETEPPSSTQAPPPLPPRKTSVPAFNINNSLYDSPRSSIIDNGLYNVPKSTTGYTTTSSSSSLQQQQPPSYDSLPPPLPPPMKINTITYDTISDSMTLKQLVDTHQNEFPLQVEVSAGYFGDSDCDTFSEGDRLNIHFIKQVSVAVCESGGYGHKIKIPINSVTQFSVLYNPNDDMKEALSGFDFKSVKDILAHKPLPKLVCATKPHNTSSSAHSVQSGELLLINEVKHGRFGGQSIICTSLGTNKQKRLPENCQGYFSTKPDNVKMFLPELTKNFPLPLKVVVVTQPAIDNTNVQPLPFAPSETVTITNIDKEITLIATPICDTDIDSVQDSSVMFDIPVDLDVMEVQIIVQNDNDNCEKLYVDTRQLLDSYDPSKLYKQVRVGKQDDIYYTSVREDQKNVGIELLTSEAIYSEATAILTKSLPRNTESLLSFKQNDSQNSSSERLSSMNGSSERISSMQHQNGYTTHHERPRSSPVPVIVEYSSCNKQFTSEQAPQTNGHVNDYYAMDLLKTSPSLSPAPSPTPAYLGSSMQDVPIYMASKFMSENASHYDVSGILTEVKEMRDTMNTLKLQIEALQKNMADLQNIVQDHTEYVEMMPSKNSKLFGMSCDEILNMLDRLNLSQYKDKFKSEGIDGTLLSELDEDTIRDELGITSKIHRKKLALVIQGKNTYQHLVQP